MDRTSGTSRTKAPTRPFPRRTESIFITRFIHASYTLRPPTQVRRVPVDAGEEQQVLPSLDNWCNFAMVEKSIYFIAANTKNHRLYDFTTRTASLSIPSKSLPASALARLPTAETVLFTQTDRDRNELVLVENFAE